MNCYWIIDNSKEILNSLHDNYVATLYTNIPHEGLKMNIISNHVREAFEVREAKYLIVDNHGTAHWSQVPSSVTRCMSLDKRS